MIIYYTILYFTLKIIREKFIKKKNIKLQDFFCDELISEEDIEDENQNKDNENENQNKDTENENENQNKDTENKYQLIPYKHKKKSTITLKEVYDNFFNKKKREVENDIDLNLFNIVKINKENIKKDNIIFNENKESIILEEPDNFLIYNFNSLKNNSYKIKCKLFINNCSNIKLIISDSKKRFIYDYNKENIINNTLNENINEFGFIIDNNFNIDENISLYFLFEKYDESKLIIDSLFIEIIEKSFKKEDSLIIFDINNKYIPFYTDVENILDFSGYVDNSNVFFF
jgi:hypothetical protein